MREILDCLDFLQKLKQNIGNGIFSESRIFQQGSVLSTNVVVDPPMRPINQLIVVSQGPANLDSDALLGRN